MFEIVHPAHDGEMFTSHNKAVKHLAALMVQTRQDGFVRPLAPRSTPAVPVPPVVLARTRTFGLFRRGN